ncbi:MAG: phospholipid carrier-dependent glycosyltransferase, partial [Bacteroidales bacterium]
MKRKKEYKHHQAVVKNPSAVVKVANPEKRKKEHEQQQSGKKNPPMTKQVVTLDKWKYYIALIIIILISFITYLPVFHNSLLAWDDDGYIKNNPLIYSINLKEIFSQYVLGNYHPVTILTLATEYHFFGSNETGYHVVNLFLHLLNVIFVFYTVFLLSDKAGVALVASLLFGIHPLHVESVAWVAELKDLLYAFFFLASYVFYLKYIKNQQKKFYLIAFFLFLVSLLSKAMAVSLPVVLILTDYFKGRKINIKTLLEKVPFFLLAFVIGVLAILAQKSSAAIQDMAIYTFPQRIVFACYGFITYLFKLLLPLNLSAYYPYPGKNGVDIPIQYYAYIIFFLGLAAF